MKCAICGHKTNWDESHGRTSFIVCPSCHDEIAKIVSKGSKKYYKITALEIILKIGQIKEEEEENERIF